MAEMKISDKTFPQLFMDKYQKQSGKVAMRFKVFGRWRGYSWNECYEMIKYMSLGLVSFGMERDDKVAIVGDNEPTWYWAEMAAQAAGGLVIPLYVDSTPDELGYIMGHSDCKFVIAKDQEQVDKFLVIKDQLFEIARRVVDELLQIKGGLTQEQTGTLLRIRDDLEQEQLGDKLRRIAGELLQFKDKLSQDTFREIEKELPLFFQPDLLPMFEKIIYWDPKGLRAYDEPILMSLNELVDLGRQYEQANPGAFEKNVEQGSPDDYGMVMYTSGTTGKPKGALLPYRSWLRNMEMWSKFSPFYPSDNYVSFIPPAWSTEQLLGITGWVTSGHMINFPEGPDTMQHDIREIAPNFILYGSRLWESVVSTIQAKMQDAGSLKRFSYGLALPIGYKVARLRFAKKKVNLFWRVLYALAHFAVFRPLKDQFGLTKARIALTGGSALGPDVMTYFHALGLRLRQAYGSTEAAVATMHRVEDVKFESVGEKVKDEVEITEEGEIIIGGEGIFAGYYKNPEETAKTLIDGYVHTGDAGYIDEDNHLIFWDRLTDLRLLRGGKKFSPLYIESRLRFSPYIKDAVALGNENSDYVTALLNIDYDNVGKWAEKRRIVFTTFTDLSQKPEVYDLIQKEIERVNRTLPDWSRVKRFTNLYKELDPDEAELTRTRKLRRKFVEERYRDILDLLYSDKEEADVRGEIKYRDGRTGMMSAHIKLRTLA